MTSNSRDTRRELRDWSIITVIILIGFLCLIAAGSLAVRFPPSWKLPANMDSLLDPNSDFLTRRPQSFIEPVDQSILTPPIWLGLFQTPGATFLPPSPLPVSTQVVAATLTATAPVITTSNPTRTPIPTNTPIPTSTIIFIPASPTNTPLPPPTPAYVDLQITKDDSITMYSAGSLLTYIVSITNFGPSNVTGAVITDAFPVQFASWEWICTVERGGAKGCNAAASNSTNFSDTVNLPNGATIIYTVRAQVLPGAVGDLVNTAVVTVPAAYIELDPSNNTATDTDVFLAATTLPIGNIGDIPDGLTDVVAPDNAVTIRFSTPLAVNGHAGYDLVYYELPSGAGIEMDLVALEIGNGTNWYTVFYWGDDVADTNSTMNFSSLGETPADAPEIDNRDFSSPPEGLLYNGTGIAIELDGILPPGTYPYLRIISPPTTAYPLGVDLDGGCEVDAIVILP